jgi:hypothetical protein
LVWQLRGKLFVCACLQAWELDPTTKEILATGSAKSNNEVLDVSNFGADGPGSVVWIYHKTGLQSQKWDYDPKTGLVKSLSDKYTGPGDLCLDATPYVAPRPCSIAPGNSSLYCDHTADINVRVADLVSKIQDQDVVGLFSNGASGVVLSDGSRLPKYQWWSEALHGVGGSPGVTFTSPTPNATSFPQVILTSSSFNTTLFRSIGNVISTEARAFNNAGKRILTTYLNITDLNM